MSHLIGEKIDLQNVILDDHTIPMKKFVVGKEQVPNNKKAFIVTDKIFIQNNVKMRKILICGIGPDEYNRISSCQDVKQILDTL